MQHVKFEYPRDVATDARLKDTWVDWNKNDCNDFSLIARLYLYHYDK